MPKPIGIKNKYISLTLGKISILKISKTELIKEVNQLVVIVPETPAL